MSWRKLRKGGNDVTTGLMYEILKKVKIETEKKIHRIVACINVEC